MFFTKKYKNLIKKNNQLLKENNQLLKAIKERLLILDIPLDYKKYWINDNLQNIIPLNQSKYPEGFNPADVVNELLRNISYEKIVDFGCGYGRLSNEFDAKKYLGIDLNPKAIIAAKKNNPQYSYMEIDINSEYPKCDVVFAHTVFLHNDDKTLASILKRLNNTECKCIIVSDIISKDWHNGFMPPTYFRSVEDYNNLFNDINFKLTNTINRPYERYAKLDEFKDKNTDLTFLLYERM